MKGMKADAFVNPTNRRSHVHHEVILADAMIDDVQGDTYRMPRKLTLKPMYVPC